MCGLLKGEGGLAFVVQSDSLQWLSGLAGFSARRSKFRASWSIYYLHTCPATRAGTLHLHWHVSPSSVLASFWQTCLSTWTVTKIWCYVDRDFGNRARRKCVTLSTCVHFLCGTEETYSRTRFQRHGFIRHRVYIVRYFVVPINPSLLTITLLFSVITTLFYNDTKYSVPITTLEQN
jgi:hypothetical protein